MVTCADTSFLFSIYGNDSRSPDALAWTRRNPEPIHISCLNRFELLNALRLAEFRRLVSSGQAAVFTTQFEQDIQQGRLIETPANLAAVLTEASRLSAARTIAGGHRGFDILHVAAARIIGATRFLTFDTNQKRLAKMEGISVPI